MARYAKRPPVTGTIGPMCIYQMHGKYFLRSRSSLTGARVKKDPAFRETMRYAGLLAQASRIGSAIYALLPADTKRHPLYRTITGEAMTWLKYGWSAAEVLDWLQKRYTGVETIVLLRQQQEALPEPTEEEMIIDFERRRNRRMLRALRRGDFSVLDDPPPRKKRS